LEDLISRLGFRGCVQFRSLIPQEDVPDFFRSGDVFVIPSVVDASGDRDGLPNVVIEALSCRLPVVASNVCAIPEVIRDGETGFLVPQGDPSALAEAVLKTVRDRTKALEMAENGRQLVWRQFDLKESCGRMLRLFKEHSVGRPTFHADRTTHLG